MIDVLFRLFERCGTLPSVRAGIPLRVGARRSSVWLMIEVMALLAVGFFPSGLFGAEGLPTLSTTAEVRALSPEDANKGYPVKLRGVLTFREGNWRAFLQDETGSIFLPGRFPKDPPGVSIGAGALVEVEGRTVPGRFVPFIRPWNDGVMNLTYLGSVALPPPRLISSDEIWDARRHCEYVEIGGVVHGIRAEQIGKGSIQKITLTLGQNETRFTAEVKGPALESKIPKNLVGAIVRLRGVFSAVYTESRQLAGMHLYVNSVDDLRVIQNGVEHPFDEIPEQKIATILRFTGGTTHCVRVVGQVSLVVPESGFYLEDMAAGVWVECEKGPLPAFDQQVEVVGFPGQGDCCLLYTSPSPRDV
jgi:hypothetical protein